MNAEKRAARERARERLGHLSAERWAAASAAACARIVESVLDGGGGVRWVMGFVAMPMEIDVAGALEVLRRRGVGVALPRVDWARGTMTAAVSEGELVVGRFGVREPAASARGVELGEIDVVLVPGLAFDAAGRRLGRGKGFYDRFLGQAGLKAQTIGVCIQEAVVERVPVEAGDVAVGCVVTDVGVAV